MIKLPVGKWNIQYIGIYTLGTQVVKLLIESEDALGVLVVAKRGPYVSAQVVKLLMGQCPGCTSHKLTKKHAYIWHLCPKYPSVLATNWNLYVHVP